ncbi:AAA family ATPase [Jeongeupia chitinilytica]|uniref:DUF3696 domain-containing protein n=1 Tax=Jeongeupia chitinilytica TaxID=1041641 RepID=A0ABQ3H1G1_9NEIS|nr:DUF3696 domain-containing protein [Jeongeupia chitinilytica]GHD60278.1 hypothetical protein GCM10007350_13060 [Jeongeupia chitinilytica]
MIDRLYLKNLKCFDELTLPLAPLTLLTGFNAAGKSTTTQGLLLLAQALRQGTRGPKLPLNGPLVRLGTPGDVLGQVGGSQLTLGIGSEEADIKWTLGPGEDRIGHTLSLENIKWTSESESGEYSDDGTIHTTGLLVPHQTTTSVITLINRLANCIFISAVRAGATDVFPSPDTPNPLWGDAGIMGEYAAWWFTEKLDEEIAELRRHPSEPAPSLRRQFNAWAGELFPGVEANAQRIAGTSLVRLEFRSHEADAWRRPANIGYGITYAFPILVAGLLAKPGQILVIDSPEAHLHPMGQSKMGEFLANLAHSGVQVIVETHSDHVLNGVRLAILNKNPPPEQAAVYFFNRRPNTSEDPAHVVAIHISSNGNLSEWPGGFFDQSEKDLAALAGWTIDFSGQG